MLGAEDDLKCPSVDKIKKVFERKSDLDKEEDRARRGVPILLEDGLRKVRHCSKNSTRRPKLYALHPTESRRSRRRFMRPYVRLVGSAETVMGRL